MTIPNAEHLLHQAERLIAPSGPGAPRQTDLRRAISSAYYAVFHSVLAAGADEFVGSTRRNEPVYALCYRRVDHRALRDLCTELKKPRLAMRYKNYEAELGSGARLPGFAVLLVELQEGRYAADYDPAIRLKRSDATIAIGNARIALEHFAAAPPTSRRLFLALLLFPPR